MQTKPSSPLDLSAQKQTATALPTEQTELVTPNVFIDTTEFRAAHLSYDTGLFAALLKHVKNGVLTVYETPILIGEVGEQIAEVVDLAVQAARKFRKDADGIRETSLATLKPLFSRLDRDALIEDFASKFADYRAAASPIEIPIAPVSVPEIVADYFSKRPPFGSGRKKSEFPDSINIKALDNWCLSNAASMYFVSADEGARKAAEATGRLIPLASLQELLGIAAASPTHLEASLRGWLTDQVATQIEPLAKRAFLQAELWLEDYESEVEEVVVESLLIDDFDVVDLESTEASVRAWGSFTASADVQFDDPNDGIWDSEEKTWFWQPHYHRKVRFTVHTVLDIEVERTSTESDWTVSAVYLNEGAPIYLPDDMEVIHDYPGNGWEALRD